MTNHPTPEKDTSDVQPEPGQDSLPEDASMEASVQPDNGTEDDIFPDDSRWDSLAPEAPTAEDSAAGDSPEERAPEERTKALEEEIARLKSDYLRVLADAENTRRMAQKKVEDNTQYAVNNFAKDLLAVADNLGRALGAIPDEARSNDMVKTLATGVELTEKEFLSVFSRYGITRLNSQGQPFNPHHHQAMQEVERTDVPAGTVVQVYQEAWMIHNRLLRPAMVVVSKGGPKRTETESAPEGDTSSGGTSSGEAGTSNTGSDSGIDMSA